MTNAEDIFFEPLQQALFDAFPSEPALVQMVQFKLMRNLDEFSGAGTGVSNRAFDLIKWAKSHAGMRHLAEKAHEHNPDNRKLKTVMQNLEILERFDDLLIAHEGQALSVFLEKLRGLFTSKKYETKPAIFFAFLDLVPMVQQELDKGMPLFDALGGLIDGTLIPDEWEYREVYEKQNAVFTFILSSYRDELPALTFKNKIISVILMVMTAQEAKELESGELLKSLPLEIQHNFDELKDTLLNNGAADWVNFYGDNAEDWHPFGLAAGTIKELVMHEIEALTNEDPEINVEFFDIGLLSRIEERQQLKALRDKDCIVIIDTVSMCHPVVHSRFHESVLDVYSNTYVLTLAPVHDAFQKLREMSLIIQLKLENMEFAKRKTEAEPQNEDCEYSHDTAKFGEWFSKYAKKIVGAGVNDQFFK